MHVLRAWSGCSDSSGLLRSWCCIIRQRHIQLTLDAGAECEHSHTSGGQETTHLDIRLVPDVGCNGLQQGQEVVLIVRDVRSKDDVRPQIAGSTSMVL